MKPLGTGIIDIKDYPFGAQQDDLVVGSVQEGPCLFLTFSQRLFSLLVIRDIKKDATDIFNLSLLITNDLSSFLYPMDVFIFGSDSVFPDI